MNELIENKYSISVEKFELLRDGGSISYSGIFEGKKFFLRIIKPTFFDTAVNAVEIQTFLQYKNFPVPPIVSANDGSHYIKEERKDGCYLYVLYEYIEGEETDPKQDANEIGALIGKLHSAMKDYRGSIVKRDKHFYIERYVNILHKKQYGKADEFEKYGNALWEKIKTLPRGYCHGDMYSGNIHKATDGKLYILDFDTSCIGFPIYDIALICNMTDYFNYDESLYDKTKNTFNAMLPHYQKYNPLTAEEINSFYDMIALYHFALQATIIEIHGINCVDNQFFDKQLEWIYKWHEQCNLSLVQK
jgi:Ser/Thr protein kinase RdoA (MazF antagonist)